MADKKGLYVLHIDGGKKASAAGEMGEGAIGALLKEPNGSPIVGAEISKRLEDPVPGPTTAEYEAFLAGLEMARDRGIEYIAIFSDSRTLVNQINNLWKKNVHLGALCERAQAALKSFKGTQVSWVPRAWNKEADALVNKAFDSADQIIHSEENDHSSSDDDR